MLGSALAGLFACVRIKSLRLPVMGLTSSQHPCRDQTRLNLSFLVCSILSFPLIPDFSFLDMRWLRRT